MFIYRTNIFMIYKMLTLFRSQRKAIYSFGSLQFVMDKAHNKQGTSTGVTTTNYCGMITIFKLY